MQALKMILMLKKDNIIERELCTLDLGSAGAAKAAYIHSAYGVCDAADESGEEDSITIRLTLTLPGDFLDWEYNAIYDYYDAGIFDDTGVAIAEIEDETEDLAEGLDTDNPAWVVSFPYTEGLGESKLADKIIGILNLHAREIAAVLEDIKDAEGDYAV